MCPDNADSPDSSFVRTVRTSGIACFADAVGSHAPPKSTHLLSASQPRPHPYSHWHLRGTSSFPRRATNKFNVGIELQKYPIGARACPPVPRWSRREGLYICMIRGTRSTSASVRFRVIVTALAPLPSIVSLYQTSLTLKPHDQGVLQS